jgi:hypothetical protein
MSEFERGPQPGIDAAGEVGNAIGAGEAETPGQGAERFLGAASAEPSGDRACHVRITAARGIVGFESEIAHNRVAEVVGVESGQGFRFGEFGRRRRESSIISARYRPSNTCSARRRRRAA